jgi:hypothetical protein
LRKITGVGQPVYVPVYARKKAAMIRIAIAAEAVEAICATLPVGSVMYEAETNAKGERLIWLEGKGSTCAAPAKAQRRDLAAGGNRKPCGTPARLRHSLTWINSLNAKAFTV